MPSLSPRVVIVGACLCWALGTIFSKTLLSSFPPHTILVLQLAPSVIALWLAIIASGASVPPRRRLLPIALLGLLNPGWAYTFSMFGLATTSASVTTLLWGVRADPHPWSRGRVVLRDLYRPGTKHRRRSVVPPRLQQTVAFAWMLAIWPIEFQSVQMPSIAAIPIADIAKIIVSGLLYYAAAYWLYLHALRSMPARVAGNFFNLIPVFGVIGSFVFLGERLSPLQWSGGVMIIEAALVVLRRNYDSPVADAETERRRSQQNRPLSALDEHQLDDLGVTSEQASKIEKRGRHRRGQ